MRAARAATAAEFSVLRAGAFVSWEVTGLATAGETEAEASEDMLELAGEGICLSPNLRIYFQFGGERMRTPITG